MHKDVNKILLKAEKRELYGPAHVPIQRMQNDMKDVNAPLLMSEESELYCSGHVGDPESREGKLKPGNQDKTATLIHEKIFDSESREGKLKPGNEDKTATLMLMFRLIHEKIFQLMSLLLHKDMSTLTLISLSLTYSDDTWAVNESFINSHIMSKFSISRFEAPFKLIHSSSSSSEFHHANSVHPSSNGISGNESDFTGKMYLTRFLEEVDSDCLLHNPTEAISIYDDNIYILEVYNWKSSFDLKEISVWESNSDPTPIPSNDSSSVICLNSSDPIIDIIIEDRDGSFALEHNHLIDWIDNKKFRI